MAEALCNVTAKPHLRDVVRGSLFTLESFLDYFFFCEMSICHFDFLGLCSKDFGIIQTEIGK